MSAVRLTAGAPAPRLTLTPVDGPPLALPDPERLVHLHFSRFADCPICNLHIASLRDGAARYAAGGVQPMLVFHSPADQVRTYRGAVPYPLVADPDRSIYARFGVEPSRRALLHPRAIARLAAEARAGRRAQEAHGGISGLPADFLIAPDGRLWFARYGRHADDAAPLAVIIAAARSWTEQSTEATLGV